MAAAHNAKHIRTRPTTLTAAALLTVAAAALLATPHGGTFLAGARGFCTMMGLIITNHASPQAGMGLLLRFVVAAALVAAAALPRGAGALRVDLKLLIITSPGFANTNFLENVMDGYGAPYTVLRVAGGENFTELLWAPDGTARYAGYVMYPNLEAMGTLTAAQVEQLWAYQRATGARSVKFGAWPTNVGVNVDVTACSSADTPMRFTAAMPLGASGVKRTASLSSLGLWRCPGVAAAPLPTCSMWAADFAATGMHPACKATPVLEFAPADGGAATHAAGALVAYADGRESLAFFFECGAWSTSCLVLGHAALAYLVRDLIPGERRALVTPHVDDFLLTMPFDAAAPKPVGVSAYRATPADLTAHADWLDALNAKLPSGSDLRLELAFNGAGVPGTPRLNVDDRSCADMPEYKALGCACWAIGADACPADAPQHCRDCAKDWAKPRGSGVNRVPANALLLQNNLTAAAADPLYALVLEHGPAVSRHLFFSHHTFTHENLDNATYFDTDAQIVLNVRMANQLNLTGRPNFSSRCMVTPQISGLRNGDALAALAANGITCGVGDNTWAFLKNEANPYHLLRTTEDDNGFAGFDILPRFATEIYYNCSTPAQNEQVYNRQYAGTYGGASTIDDIVAREAVRVVRDGLLKLRHDPYMFHQANLALLDGAAGRSLVMRWVEAVVDEFERLLSWPVASLPLDALYDLYLARQARDACQLGYTADVAPDGTVAGVVVTRGEGVGVDGACPAALILPIGEAVAVSVPAAQGSVRAALPPGIAWARA